MSAFFSLIESTFFLILAFLFVVVYIFALGHGLVILFFAFCYGFFIPMINAKLVSLTRYSGFVISFFSGVTYGYLSSAQWPNSIEECQTLCGVIRSENYTLLQPLAGYAAYLITLVGIFFGIFFYKRVGSRTTDISLRV